MFSEESAWLAAADAAVDEEYREDDAVAADSWGVDWCWRLFGVRGVAEGGCWKDRIVVGVCWC